jgi:hypothetical protein
MPRLSGCIDFQVQVTGSSFFANLIIFSSSGDLFFDAPKLTKNQ